MKRIRLEDDGSETTFELVQFEDGTFHAEVRVSSLDELRSLRNSGTLIGIRMRGKPAGKTTQTSIIPWREIEGF